MNRRADDVTGWSYAHMCHPEPGSVVGPASTLTARWPFHNRLDLGAFPGAVPSARLHARLVALEWGLEAIAEKVELVVSELVTNGVKAARSMDEGSAIRLELFGDEGQVFVAVWDGNPKPVHAPILGDDELPDLEAEGGRGLFLVASLGTDWGMYWPDDAPGKVVWCLVTVPEAVDIGTGAHRPLPKRVPSDYPIRWPAHPMDDPMVLERVRQGLKRLI
jgi:anti-sigma regulatory factor (Ser/Thr protein kinase)